MTNLKLAFPLAVFLSITLSNKVFSVDPPFLKLKSDLWVNEQLENMTLEDRIAQLMMISVYPKQSEESKQKVIQLIKKHRPGGILVMQGTPAKSASWINQFQEVSEIPLLVSIDAEWGLTMRIDSTMRYPYAQALGALKDSAFIYQMGRDIGNQLKSMGIHMNFAPVADVNTNPENPVINFRSFSEDKINVSQKAWWLASGMQQAGVLPVAKHFPGHGDTKTDSHLTLPLIDHPKKRIDAIESFPFRFLAEKGISGIMSAHLNVPAIDSAGVPSSLSKKILTDYLKGEIGFSGFVVSDAMNMKGVRTEGNAEVEAVKAGNDILEFIPDVEQAIQAIKQAVENGEIQESEITEKCRTVLALKRWVNLHEYQPANLKNLTARLNSPYYEATSRKLVKESLTVLQNREVLPVKITGTLKIASVNIGGSNESVFQEFLSKYTPVDHFVLPKEASEKSWVNLRQKLKNYNLILAGIEGVNIYPSEKYGLSDVQIQAISGIIQENKSVVVFFGNAYALKHFENIHHADGLILAYQNTTFTQELAAQLVFGGIGANGKLPVTIDKRFKLNDGLEVEKNQSLAYSIPEEFKINSRMLEQKIDSIAVLGIDSAAYPGCQVLIAKNGHILFHKCYGFHTYEKEIPVKKNNIYDWASITKVAGPLPALMKLVDENKINLDLPFSTYWKDFQNTDKEKLTFREILAHQARLAAWIPYWRMTLTPKGKLDKKVFKMNPSKNYSIRVSKNLYMTNDFKKTMFDTIRNSKLLSRKKYLYSGLSFYVYPEMIENLTGMSYETYLKDNFYKPLGATTVTFNAYKHFPEKQIIPTETDDFFRNERLVGFVHDEGAAMMGGISGNAGLFGSANDLAKIFQMYLQKGYYGGRRYLSEKTVNEFTRIQFPENGNRRGLGFDKPLIDNHKNDLANAYPAVDASKNSYGHSGYTGTFAWADPDEHLLFIFMSNRVHPTRENQKLFQLNIRPAMHQAIYDCLKSGTN